MRSNATQSALELAAACRAYDADLDAIRVREAILPIRWRRLMSLAAMIAAQPIGERRTMNRRARRAGR